MKKLFNFVKNIINVVALSSLASYCDNHVCEHSTKFDTETHWNECECGYVYGKQEPLILARN